MIDPKIQQELRARFNPDGSDLRRMQLRMLDMLKHIDKICQDNDIKYWLSSGTCLGAVRHGGFIPWDDDCDIEMSIKDYKRLIKILRSSHEKNQYQLQDITTEKNYVLPFAKLRDTKSSVQEDDSPKYSLNGCWVDIFPLEYGNVHILKFCAKIHNILLNPKNKHHISNTLIQQFFKKFYFYILVPSIRIFKIFYNKNYYYHTYGICFYKKRHIEDVTKVTYVKFENISLPIPRNYHHYLTTLYGNYEKLPIAKDQKTHELHDIKLN